MGHHIFLLINHAEKKRQMIMAQTIFFTEILRA